MGVIANLLEAAKRAIRGAAPIEATNRPTAPTVQVNYRDEAEEMARAEGAFVFRAPDPRPIEEQKAFDEAAVAEAPFAMQAKGNGVFESANPSHTGPAPLTHKQKQRMYEQAEPMREAMQRVTSGGRAK